jgi:hypothetical protein
MYKYLLACFLFFVAACNIKSGQAPPNGNKNLTIYSDAVKDSFNIFISTPPGYDAKKKYPVVYLLDANLYFDIIAPAVGKYIELGGIQPCILVGIGYKNFSTMDSLRSRDYTYPTALPRYEMVPSGHAERFLTFIGKELKPYMQHHYAVDTTNTTLLGHSLGGYFTIYALYQRLAHHDRTFNRYIAASPSLDYNDQYIAQQLALLTPPVDQDSFKLYLTFGGSEDSEDDDTTGTKTSVLLDSFSRSFAKLKVAKAAFKSDTFSNLGHMDTPYPTFIKGLSWVLPGN